MRTELVGEEIYLRDQVSDALAQIKSKLSSSAYDVQEVRQLLEQMGTSAHRLHTMLARRGHTPRHHRYMVPNRRLEADHPDFYKHVHPTEDLLAFIENDHANDDPEDQTLGHEFTLSVYSARWGHHDTYFLTRTKTGWSVRFTDTIDCDKAGRPYLYDRFANDAVYYPEVLDGRLEWLWNRASEDGLPHDDVQNALNQLADWINITSANAPRDGVWYGC